MSNTATIPASVGTLALAFPERVIGNDYFRECYPELVHSAEERVLGKLWRPDDNSKSRRFDAAASHYMQDPFRGCVERRWLAPGEKAIELEERAARSALAASGMAASDVDLMICASFFPDQPDVGNAAFLAQRLNLGCPAWNLESACAGGVIALETAASLIGSGAHRNVLCVTSCTYSRLSPEDDTLGWGNGDGAAAFVVSPVNTPAGLLAFHSISTNVTCGAIYARFELGEEGEHQLRMHTSEAAGRVLRETAEPFLLACVDGALRKAKLRRDDIDLYIFNTPTAWYIEFCADALGVPLSKTVNAHPHYGNVGPVLTPANLYHAARDGQVKPGLTVLLYAVGSVSNATAAVVRFADLRLGA